MVRYFWSESNGTNRPTVRYMDFEPSTEYYNGMPLKKNEAGAVMPTTGEPEYICMWDYQPDGDIRTLEIPVIEIFPDTIYEKWNEDGTVEEVRFGSGGGGLPSDLVETVPDEVPLEITFDGNLEGKETVPIEEGAYFVKVSDNVLSVGDLLGGTIVAYMESGKQAIELTTETVMDAGSQGIPAIMIMEEMALVVYGDVSSALGFNLSNGVWFAVSGEYYMESLSNPNVTITTGELKKLDPKFYDQPCGEKVGDVFYSSILTTTTTAGMNIAYVQEPILYQTEKVLVSIDGNEEIKEVKTRDDVNNQVWYTVGNLSLYFDDAENTGEFYLLLCNFLGETPQSATFITRIGGSYDVKLAGIYAEPLPEKFMPELNQLTMISPSGKKFSVTVDDSGKLTAVEV